MLTIAATLVGSCCLAALNIFNASSIPFWCLYISPILTIAFEFIEFSSRASLQNLKPLSKCFVSAVYSPIL